MINESTFIRAIRGNAIMVGCHRQPYTWTEIKLEKVGWDPDKGNLKIGEIIKIDALGVWDWVRHGDFNA